MLGVTDDALDALDSWLNTVTSKSRFKFWRNKADYQKTEKERLDKYVQVKEKMDRVLEAFENEKRYAGLVFMCYSIAELIVTTATS